LRNFRTNFSDLKLLSKQPILGWIDDTEFEIIPPKLMTYYKANFALLLSLLEKDEAEIKNFVEGHEFDNHYSLFSFILSAKVVSEDIMKVNAFVLTGLQEVIPSLTFEDKLFKIKDSFLNEKIFNEIIMILFRMLKKKKIIINKDDDKFTKREKEMKLKIQKIKENGKGDGGSNSIESMLVSIIYEFPQYTLEDLFELNIYTIYYLFGYVGKIANYQVSQIAYATGNFKKGKKHKYFIEK